MAENVEIKEKEYQIKRLELLPAAKNNPKFVLKDMKLDEAITRLALDHYSHMPIASKRGGNNSIYENSIVGDLSWESYGNAIAKGVDSDNILDYASKNYTILPITTPLLEALDTVYRNGFIYVSDTEEHKICGIVTIKDLSTQFQNWTKPYTILMEIESWLRVILEGVVPQEELKKYNNDKDAKSLDEMTFAGYVGILSDKNRWDAIKHVNSANINFKNVDLKYLSEELEKIRTIRNKVMHFNFSTNGLEEYDLRALTNMGRYLFKLVEK